MRAASDPADPEILTLVSFPPHRFTKPCGQVAPAHTSARGAMRAILEARRAVREEGRTGMLAFILRCGMPPA